MTEQRVLAHVEMDAFASEVRGVIRDGHRLAALFAVPLAGGLRIVAALAGQEWLSVVSTDLPRGALSYQALTPTVPAADWYEREIRDLYGVEPIGHPDPDPLVLPRPTGVRAPRPGSGDANVPTTPGTAPLAALVSGEGVFTIPYGPVRSGVFEAIEYLVETPGEDIPRVRTRAHYKHRGLDRAFDGRSPEDGVLVAERAEGVAAVAHASAYCGALERIAGTEVPVAAQLVRVVHAELERIANHLDSTARHAEAAGQAVAYARLGVHKERVMRLRAELCGSRFGRSVVVPGGVSGRPLIASTEMLAALGPLEREIRKDLEVLTKTPSFLDRLRGTGLLALPVVAARGALGPVGRGSGLEEDVRTSRPYGGYRRLDFAPSSRSGGDALARQLVRSAEVDSSFHLLRQAAGELASLEADSNTTWATPLEVASGEEFGWAEAPQGEVLYFVLVEDGVLGRVRARSASFHNLALFTAAFPKDITTDFAFIEASFGLSIAGVAG